MTIEWTSPANRQELEQAEAAFDQASRELTGPMSEDMFDQAKRLSMLKRLYDEFPGSYDFSKVTLKKLMQLTEMVTRGIATLDILNDGNNADIKHLYQTWAIAKTMGGHQI